MENEEFIEEMEWLAIAQLLLINSINENITEMRNILKKYESDGKN
jgi:hypothetical protein